MFESSVILEGSKTLSYALLEDRMFESSVILEGSKTLDSAQHLIPRLRVVLF